MLANIMYPYDTSLRIMLQVDQSAFIPLKSIIQVLAFEAAKTRSVELQVLVLKPETDPQQSLLNPLCGLE